MYSSMLDVSTFCIISRHVDLKEHRSGRGLGIAHATFLLAALNSLARRCSVSPAAKPFVPLQASYL